GDKADEVIVVREPAVHQLVQPWTIGIAGAGALALVIGLVMGAMAFTRPTAVPNADLFTMDQPAKVERTLTPVDARPAVVAVDAEPALTALLEPAAADLPVVEEVVLEAKQIAVEAKPEPKQEKLVIKRRDRSSDEELRRQLLKAPEL